MRKLVEFGAKPGNLIEAILAGVDISAIFIYRMLCLLACMHLLSLPSVFGQSVNASARQLPRRCSSHLSS